MDEVDVNSEGLFIELAFSLALDRAAGVSMDKGN